MQKLYFTLISLIIFSSCSSYLYTGNGAIHNANFTTDQYTINKLDITKTGDSWFGIPVNKKTKNASGFTFSFNGITISKVPQFFPVVSLLSFTYLSGILMSEIGIGAKEELYEFDYYYGYESYGNTTTPNFLSYVLGLPVALTLNTVMWNGASKGAAGSEINTEMLVKNKDVDMFLFPKYTIQTDGFFRESSTVNLKVKAATLRD